MRFRIVAEYLSTIATGEGKKRYFELDDRYAQFGDILKISNSLVSELLEASLVGLIQCKEGEDVPVDFEAHGRLMAQIVETLGKSPTKVKRLSGRELRQRRARARARASRS